jgi:hypothetical protein
MKHNRAMAIRFLLLISLMASLTILSTKMQADTGSCGGVTITLPFTDTMASPFFCQIAAAYFSGLTNGTTATTYSPTATVTREQMAAFITRTMDQSLRRGSKRAALGQWWTTKVDANLIVVGIAPQYVVSDGIDLWVSNTISNSIWRLRAVDASPLTIYTNVPSPEDLVVAGGGVFIASFQSPGKIYYTNASRSSNEAIEWSTNLGNNPVGITFDGANLWTSNFGTGPGTGSISKASPIGAASTTYLTGFSQPLGILFDGSSLWVTDRGDNTLKRVDINDGSVLETTSLGANTNPSKMVFDGTNLWVPCYGTNELLVVRATGGLRGTVLARLTGNGLSGPIQAGFDGERILVTNSLSGTDGSVSLWKATDLSFIGSVNFNKPLPTGVCSDGQDFFITFHGSDAQTRGVLIRF